MDYQSRSLARCTLLKDTDLVLKIEGYWNEYKNLIIFSKSFFTHKSLTCKVFATIVTFYVLCILYCCYHCVHDFCRCCCCYVRCTYKCERWCWRHRGPSISYCKLCCHAAEKQDFHKCSRWCLYLVPRSIRNDLERQHGDLTKGWWDLTYFARAGGRYELPEDPVERAKWHWWGHEEGWVHKGVESTLQCLGTTVDKEKRLMKELSSASGRDEHFTKLSRQMSRAGGRLRQEGEDLKERINRQWAERKSLVHELNRTPTKAEKRMVDRSQSRLEKKMKSEHWNSDDSGSEDEKPRKRDTGGKI